MEAFLTPEFLIAVGQIIMIDIVLGGDNAVVIALACRKLPPPQRVKGILWGTAGAIVLRVILIFFALQLLAPSCWCGLASSCCCPSTTMATATSQAVIVSGVRSRR